LGDILFDPGPLQRMKFRWIRRQSFDRGDGAINQCGRRNQAGKHRLAIDVNGTGPALTDTTTKFRAHQSQLVSQYPQKRRVFVDDVYRVSLTIDDEAHMSVRLLG
jgi:hypothetical protein